VLKTSISNLFQSVKDIFSDEIETIEIKDEKYVSITVKYDYLLFVAETLKNKLDFTIPIACGGIDYLDEDKMQMIYYISNPKSRFVITLRVDIPRNSPQLPSLTKVWEAMSFHEREANEMFGVEFKDHPNMVPLLLPPSWRGGYPLRKDFKGEGIK
jgi:NADH-quinone oxidoreductase subunit C